MDEFLERLINGQLTPQEVKIFDEFLEKHLKVAPSQFENLASSQCLFTTVDGKLLIDKENIDYISEAKTVNNRLQAVLRTKTGTRFTLAENIFDSIEAD